MEIDKEHIHMKQAWKEYIERHETYWNKAVENLKKHIDPGIDPDDDSFWPEICEEMDRIGWTYDDIENKFGVGIEHEDTIITITDFMGTDGDEIYATTSDGTTYSAVHN